RNSGRFADRRSTLNWYRNTAFSTSSAAAAPRPTTSRASRRMTRCTKKKTTPPDPTGTRPSPDQGFRPLQARIKGLYELSLDVFSQNAAAIALYHKFGFVKQGGVSRNTVTRAVWDSIVMEPVLGLHHHPASRTRFRFRS